MLKWFDSSIEFARKRPKPSEATLSVSEMFPPAKKEYKCLTRKPNKSDREKAYSELCRYRKFTGLWWLMSPEPKTVNELLIPTILDVIYSEEFLLIQETRRHLEFLRVKTKIGEQKIEEVEKLTRGQRENPNK